MIKLFGITLGLVGTTVLGGMGLSYAHEALYVEATPVRAEVVAPNPVLSRAAPVLTRRTAPVLNRTVQPASVESAAPVEVVRLSKEVSPATSDAPIFVPARNLTETVDQPSVLGRSSTGAAPVLSSRPKLRSLPQVTRSAELDTPRATPPAPRPKRVLARPRRETRTQQQPVLQAARQQTPRFVIGVYR